MGGPWLMVACLFVSGCKTIGEVFPNPSVLRPSTKIALRLSAKVSEPHPVEESNVKIENLRRSLQNGFDYAFGPLAIPAGPVPKGQAALVLDIEQLVFREQAFPYLGFFLTLKTRMVLYAPDGQQTAQCAGTVRSPTPGIGESELQTLIESTYEGCSKELFQTPSTTGEPAKRDASEI